MFWDRVACVYDIFANVINRKANKRLCAAVEALILPSDRVLECACGTGLLSGGIARRCRRLVATDFSAKMLRRAYPDASFDAVVAANVIHLLDDPYQALHELDRVCRNGGRIIIPTYMNRTEKGTTNKVSGAIGKAGADFKREFTPASYKAFFASVGYTDVTYTLCEGKIPCMVAEIHKHSHEGEEIA